MKSCARFASQSAAGPSGSGLYEGGPAGVRVCSSGRGGGPLVRDPGGVCESASIGITGVASKAYRASGAEAALKGSAVDEHAIAAAAQTAADGSRSTAIFMRLRATARISRRSTLAARFNSRIEGEMMTMNDE